MVDPLTVRAEEHVPIELTLCDTMSPQIVIQCIFALQNSTICTLKESLVTAPSPRRFSKKKRGLTADKIFCTSTTIDRIIMLWRLGINHTAIVLLYRVR